MESGGSESEKATHDRAIILPAKAVPSSAILTRGIVLSDQDRCELDELERSGVWSGISAVQRPQPAQRPAYEVWFNPAYSIAHLFACFNHHKFLRPMVGVDAANHLEPCLSAPSAVTGWLVLATS